MSEGPSSSTACNPSCQLFVDLSHSTWVRREHAYWKPRHCPRVNEITDTGKESTPATLLKQHNSSLPSKCYPYTAGKFRHHTSPSKKLFFTVSHRKPQLDNAQASDCEEPSPSNTSILQLLYLSSESTAEEGTEDWRTQNTGRLRQSSLS